MLAKPQTYMNLSGQSVAELLKFYKVSPSEHLLVIFDDISLSPGSLRIRKKGSAGGHNGIKSIIAEVGTSEFARIKVGVGQKPDGWDLADYVLGHFSKKEREGVDMAIDCAVQAAGYLVNGRMEEAMNRFNGKNKE